LWTASGKFWMPSACRKRKPMQFSYELQRSLRQTMSLTVSIILPTYNRAKFLPEAFAAIRDQQWTDWELIVVDDGSTDNTRELVPELTRGWQQPVRYIHQENLGAYGARNTGLDHATGKYIAFYDSDDLWLPHHLQDCVQALEANPDVDWVYGACRLIDQSTGKVQAESTFHINGSDTAFLELATEKRGDLYIITEPELPVKIFGGTGLYAGLQNSVIRCELFDGFRFDTSLRNEAEDQIFVMLAAINGRRFGYFDKVCLDYRIHAENSSAAATGQSLEKQRRIYEAVALGFERLNSRADLSPQQTQALNVLVSNEYFWHLGYATLWQMGRRTEAFAAYRKAMRLRPLHLPYWKTYAVCTVRSIANQVVRRFSSQP
jgi:glycosyltransferase involved in cell wall biosynthesis